MSVSVNFQNRINELIAEQGLIKSEIPIKAKVDYGTFSNAINYGIIPTTPVLIKLADFFNISLEYLLSKTENDYFSKSKIPSNFYNRIEELCKEDNKTFYKISQKLHIGTNYIYRWKIKKHLPSLEFLELFSDYFKVSIDYLLGRTDDKTNE